MAKLEIPININWNDIRKALEERDIVEVVRCKDCKWWDIDWIPSSSNFCPNVDGIRKEDFYCADGERKETEDANYSQI